MSAVDPAYPVDGVTYRDTGPRESGVGLSLRLRTIPLRPALCMDVVELGKTANIWSPAEVIDDETFHAGRFRRVNHGNSCVRPSRPDNAYGRILTRQCLDEFFSRVVDPDDLDTVWERRGGLCSGNYGDPKARVGQCCRDGSTEVSRCLCWLLSRSYLS